MKTYVVSYYEQDICHCVMMVDATCASKAKNKAIEHMESRGVGYHYWDDFFAIYLLEEIDRVK